MEPAFGESDLDWTIVRMNSQTSLAGNVSRARAACVISRGVQLHYRKPVPTRPTLTDCARSTGGAKGSGSIDVDADTRCIPTVT